MDESALPLDLEEDADQDEDISYDTDQGEGEYVTQGHGIGENTAGVMRIMRQSKVHNYSRYENDARLNQKSLRRSYKPGNNHIPKGQVVEKCSSQKSARDAFEIWSQLTEKARQGTTVQCVDLKTRHASVKKFCFTNNLTIPRKIFDKATELGYDLAATEGGHAEVQLIQFLCDRAKKHGDYYTDVVAMGCNRKHCARCDVFLQLFLGKSYHSVTAVCGGERSIEESTSVTLEAGEHEEEKLLRVTRSHQSLRDILTGTNAVGVDYLTPHFYLCGAVRSLLEKRTRRRIQILANDEVLNEPKKLTKDEKLIRDMVSKSASDKIFGKKLLEKLQAIPSQQLGTISP
ncbi:MAG: hypothetical protein AAF734_04785 [Bacteroidota bacterium]